MFFSTSHELFTFPALKVSQQKACIQVTVQQSGFVSFDLRALEVVILVSGHQGHHGAPGHHQIYGGGLLGLVGLLVGDFYWMITSIPYLLMVTVGIPIISGWWFGMVWKCLEHGFYDFPYIGNFIIPFDELIFFRGVGQPPTRYDWDLWEFGRIHGADLPSGCFTQKITIFDRWIISFIVYKRAIFHSVKWLEGTVIGKLVTIIY